MSIITTKQELQQNLQELIIDLGQVIVNKNLSLIEIQNLLEQKSNDLKRLAYSTQVIHWESINV